MIYFPPGFPFGLSGMYGIPDPLPTWQSIENRVIERLDTMDDGEAALMYKMLHARGYALVNVDAKIRAAQAKLKQP